MFFIAFLSSPAVNQVISVSDIVPLTWEWHKNDIPVGSLTLCYGKSACFKKPSIIELSYCKCAIYIHLYIPSMIYHSVVAEAIWSQPTKEAGAIAKAREKKYMPRWRFDVYHTLIYLLASSGKHIFWGNHCDHHRLSKSITNPNQNVLSALNISGLQVPRLGNWYTYLFIFHNWAGTVAPSRPHLSVDSVDHRQNGWKMMNIYVSLLWRFGDHHKRNSLAFSWTSKLSKQCSVLLLITRSGTVFPWLPWCPCEYPKSSIPTAISTWRRIMARVNKWSTG